MNWKKYGVMCGLCGVLLLVAGCLDQRFKAVSQVRFRDAWPLTVPQGQVACFSGENGEIIFFVAPDGKEYSLKGEPAPIGKVLLPISLITKRHPKNPDLFMKTDVLIEEGKLLCDPSKTSY
ncbi:hypothetical protein QUA41_28565 [Microcoleus sp. Pol11C1]|uniref:hypothetical protein n=1 Tax=unclassified Microcoleus TaxID=2642155 RepID=UPI002FD1ED23